MTALYVTAGILAALALLGIIGLAIPQRREPLPPDWVNQGRPHHGRCRRGAWRENCQR